MWLLLLSLLTLPVLSWLLQPGFWASGDGLHHLYRVDELARYVRQGVLFPRWFGEFSFGYGAPVFIFYNPLSYYLALPLAPFGTLAATKAAMAAATLLSALAMGIYARRHASLPAALLVALVYCYLPYRLVDLYVRAALAEHVAFLWFPLILLASDGLLASLDSPGAASLARQARHSLARQALALAGFALAWTGLLLTHTFSAVMFAPFSAAYVLLLAWRGRRARPLVLAGLGGLLALGLTAFFWLPLLAEQPFAGIGSGDAPTGYRIHLVSLRDLAGALVYDYTTGALNPNYYYAAGIVPLALLMVGLASALWRARRRSTGTTADAAALPAAARRSQLSAVEVALFGAGMAGAALFMCTKASQPIWDALAPVLANMQFPWRYLSIATLGIALSLLALLPGGSRSATPEALTRRRLASLIVAVLIVGALAVTAAPSLPFQRLPLAEADITPESFWAFDRDTGQAGSTWAGEFIPVWVTEQRWALGRAPDQPSAPVDSSFAAPKVTAAVIRPDWIELDVDSQHPWPLRTHAFYFPGWQVRIDGHPVETQATGDLGLVSAEVPAGRHQVRIRFETTPPRCAARWVSLAAWAVLVVLFAWAARATGRRRLAWAVLTGGALLMAAVAWGGPAPRGLAVQPVGATLENRALLVGAYAEPAQARPGDQARVTLVWLALTSSNRADKSFVHLLGPDGAILSQHDGDPGGGFTPASRWQPGEIILDRHTLSLPADLAPGSYPLRAGLYQFDPVRNLTVDPPTSDNRVDIGVLEVGR
jgi:hypothetical protein